jgi:hypothetical protein
MSVKIILDETLEQKEIKNFTKLEIKSELDLKTPDNYFSQYEHSERLLERQDRDYRTQNNFINAFIPETLIVLLGPFLSFFIYILTGVIDTFYLIFLWFYNIHLLFSEKTETSNSTSWKSGDMWGILTWYWS